MILLIQSVSSWGWRIERIESNERRMGLFIFFFALVCLGRCENPPPNTIWFYNKVCGLWGFFFFFLFVSTIFCCFKNHQKRTRATMSSPIFGQSLGKRLLLTVNFGQQLSISIKRQSLSSFQTCLILFEPFRQLALLSTLRTTIPPKCAVTGKA